MDISTNASITHLHPAQICTLFCGGPETVCCAWSELMTSCRCSKRSSKMCGIHKLEWKAMDTTLPPSQPTMKARRMCIRRPGGKSKRNLEIEHAGMHPAHQWFNQVFNSHTYIFNKEVDKVGVFLGVVLSISYWSPAGDLPKDLMIRSLVRRGRSIAI